MPKASSTMLHCVDASLAVLLQKNQEATDNVTSINTYKWSLCAEFGVRVLLPSFSVPFCLQHLCPVCVATGTWLAGAL